VTGVDNGPELRDVLRGLLCVQAGWAFGVPEDGREQWLDLVAAAVAGHYDPAPATAGRRVVQCNYAEGTAAVADGARAYVVLANPGNADDRIEVLARSRGGRWIRTWADIRRLHDFRCKTLPPEHPLYADERLWDYEPDAMAARLQVASSRDARRGDRPGS
jgi:hypothetical protein